MPSASSRICCSVRMLCDKLKQLRHPFDVAGYPVRHEQWERYMIVLPVHSLRLAEADAQAVARDVMVLARCCAAAGMMLSTRGSAVHLPTFMPDMLNMASHQSGGKSRPKMAVLPNHCLGQHPFSAHVCNIAIVATVRFPDKAACSQSVSCGIGLLAE